jgi:hypothetical protein
MESTTFCWRSTIKGSFSTDMYGCIIRSYSVWYNFCKLFLSKRPADHLANRRGPQFDKHWSIACRSCYLSADIWNIRAAMKQLPYRLSVNQRPFRMAHRTSLELSCIQLSRTFSNLFTCSVGCHFSVVTNPTQKEEKKRFWYAKLKNTTA